jgi:hypothetical protein
MAIALCDGDIIMKVRERAVNFIENVDKKGTLSLSEEGLTFVRSLYTASLIIYEGLELVANAIKEKK